jgi:hypothetical protein
MSSKKNRHEPQKKGEKMLLFFKKVWYIMKMIPFTEALRKNEKTYPPMG